jgi:hypothetical protein
MHSICHGARGLAKAQFMQRSFGCALGQVALAALTIPTKDGYLNTTFACESGTGRDCQALQTRRYRIVIGRVNRWNHKEGPV